MFALPTNFSIMPKVHFHCSYPYSVLIFQVSIFQYSIFKVTAFAQRSYLISAQQDVATVGTYSAQFPPASQLVELAPLPIHQELRKCRGMGQEFKRQEIAENMKALRNIVKILTSLAATSCLSQ